MNTLNSPFKIIYIYSGTRVHIEKGKDATKALAICGEQPVDRRCTLSTAQTDVSNIRSTYPLPGQ